MDWMQFFFNVLGGVLGGSVVAGVLMKLLLNHQLNKRLEVFKFVLTNRANACSEILQSMGKVISASRKIISNTPDQLRYYDELSIAATQLEDQLRPAVFLLDEGIYKRIHSFKSMAKSLHETILDVEDCQDNTVIHSFIKNLETCRDEITSDLSTMMSDTIRK